MISFLAHLKTLKIHIALFIAMVAVLGYLVVPGSSLSLRVMPVLFIVSFIAAAGAGAMNNFLDKDMDRHMPRTSFRPIPVGRIRRPRLIFMTGLIFLLLSTSFAFIFFNITVALHIFLGAFFYVVIYTVWLKRRHWISIVIGGLSGSFAVLGGAASAKPELCLTPALFALLLFLWSPSHFWSFSLVYREDYRTISLPVLPLIKGVKTTTLGILAHTIALVIVSILPWVLRQLGLLYIIIALIAGLALIYFAVRLFFAPHDIKAALSVFIMSNIYLLIVFLAVFLDVVVGYRFTRAIPNISW